MKTTNMHLYNTKGVITKYSAVEEILEEFYTYRLDMYEKRKEYYIRYLTNQMLIAQNRMEFIEYILKKKIIIEKKKREEVIDQIQKEGLIKLHHNIDAPKGEKSYDYLTSMSLFSLTNEKRQELKEIYEKKKQELEDYKKITIKVMWTSEIKEFLVSYDKWKKGVDEENNSNKNTKGKNTNARKKTSNDKTSNGKNKKVVKKDKKKIKVEIR